MILDRLARQPNQHRQWPERIAHQDDVAGLGRDVGASADGDAHVGSRQGRCVVDAVADHDDVLLRLEIGDILRLSARAIAFREDFTDADPERLT